MGFRLRLHFCWFFYIILLSSSSVFSDPILRHVDRRIDLTSQVVRILTTLKVENEGNGLLSELLIALTDVQAGHLAYLSVFQNEGRGKPNSPDDSLHIEVLEPEGIHPHLTFYLIALPRGLFEGETLTLEVWAAFTHILKPFPERVSQGDLQLFLFEDYGYYLSPYAVQSQLLTVKLPDARIESYTELEKSRVQGSEIKYGPYKNLTPFTESPISIHFEYNKPLTVAQKLVREVEISHWGNVQITEHYSLIHGGAGLKGGYSRIDYQSSPHTKLASAMSRLVANLLPGARSVYYRDEIGNISTSNLRSDLKKTELEIEPRYPLFGSWRAFFTVGYGLPLKDYLFEYEGKRFLNLSFGSSINDMVIDELIVKIVLPEGSSGMSVSIPFQMEGQWQETKLSHLDISGRPVMVLRKTKVVPEHNQHFQVYYEFNSLFLLREPFMLILGFFFLFAATIAYAHADLSISKSSPSYLAKLQREEVQIKLQQLVNIISQCLAIHDGLEASLQKLSRTGDLHAFKASRKAADNSLKELLKEAKPRLTFLQSSPQAVYIFLKVDDLVKKEQELMEKFTTKHSVVVDCYERKLSGREIENRVAPHQQKTTALRQEVMNLVDFIDGSI